MVVASQDKNLTCEHPLWAWVLTCNITLLGMAAIYSLVLLWDNPSFQRAASIIYLLGMLFILIWAIIGLVWSTGENKSKCGKLSTVTLGESAFFISFTGLICIIMCVGLICYQKVQFFKDFQNPKLLI
eukprot:Anaeramoba_ignava/c20464_g1_i1.p2 GENE.c20464_g1_i1~~c20464_g1_i1.p2  ORF type:complete len:128 (+),score=24.29 c20464_g1_i1:3780-4163(+)